VFGFGQSTGTSPISQVASVVFTLLIVAIFIRAILSWFSIDPRSPLVQALNAVTEPILDPIRRIMPRLGMLDLSPMVAIIVLGVMQSAVVSYFG
jgi:YggT family protein